MGTMFSTENTDLKELLDDAHNSKLQLPYFQRDPVWDKEQIRSLLASIAKGYPIGVLLILKVGGILKLEHRHLAGIPGKKKKAEELLLDGQQRITSLYQALCSEEPVYPKSSKRGVFYYLDIQKAVGGEAKIENALIEANEKKILPKKKNLGREETIDLSEENTQFERCMFPLNQVFHYDSWRTKWANHWKNDALGKNKLTEIMDQFRILVGRINSYRMPVIYLNKESTPEDICTVFERVNTGGKKLGVFELVTANFARFNFKLRDDLIKRREKFETNNKVFEKIFSNLAFLQTCSILHTWENEMAIGCSRGAILGLPLEAYKKWASPVEEGVVRAGKFFNKHKIISPKDIPYVPQIVALAATFAILDKRGKAVLNDSEENKLNRWFWSVIFGELYRASTDTRLARDIPELVKWLSADGTPPRSIAEASFQINRLDSLHNSNSAVAKGLHVLLMKAGCQDFITGTTVELSTYFNNPRDSHHIFPQKWCKRQNISKNKYDSVINRTPLSKATNLTISADDPSCYLKKIETKHTMEPTRLDDILRSHKINPVHLRNDNFDAFYEERKEALAELVAQAMGKVVVRETDPEEEQHEEGSDPDLDHEAEAGEELW